MENNNVVLKSVTIKKRANDILNSMPSSFNFSGWVSEQIEEKLGQIDNIKADLKQKEAELEQIKSKLANTEVENEQKHEKLKNRFDNIIELHSNIVKGSLEAIKRNPSFLKGQLNYFNNMTFNEFKEKEYKELLDYAEIKFKIETEYKKQLRIAEKLKCM